MQTLVPFDVSVFDSGTDASLESSLRLVVPAAALGWCVTVIPVRPRGAKRVHAVHPATVQPLWRRFRPQGRHSPRRRPSRRRIVRYAIHSDAISW